MGNSGSKKKGKSKAPPVLCEPTGLYDTCPWSTRAVGRLIVAKKLAPRHKGTEDDTGAGVDAGEEPSECPICFLYYKEVNNVTCCNKDICTECYLQVKLPTGPSACPFCNSPALDARYTPPSSTSKSSPPPNERSPSVTTPPPPSPPTPSTTSPVVVSIAERHSLEHAMQSQRGSYSRADYGTPQSRTSSTTGNGSRSRNSSMGSDSNVSNRRRSGGRAYVSGGGSRRQQQRERGFRSQWGQYEGYGDHEYEEQEEQEQEEFDMRFNLEQVEEMMLMEAIRLSMLETETETTTPVSSTLLPPPPPPTSDNHVANSYPHMPSGEDQMQEKMSHENNTNEEVVDENNMLSTLQHMLKMCGDDEDRNEALKEDVRGDLKEDIKENTKQENKDMNDGEREKHIDEESDDTLDDEQRMLELALTMSLSQSSIDTVGDSAVTSSNMKSFAPSTESLLHSEPQEKCMLESENDSDITPQQLSNSIVETTYSDNSHDDDHESADRIVVQSDSPSNLLRNKGGGGSSGSLSPAAQVLVDKIDRALGENEDQTEGKTLVPPKIIAEGESDIVPDLDRGDDNTGGSSEDSLKVNKVLFSDSAS